MARTGHGGTRVAGGYHGRYLRVDLATGSATLVPLPEEVLRRVIGGIGLGTWILTRENPAGIEPLAPEAAVVFALSPLVGTALTTSAKFAVVCKSPLTQRLNDALSSSHFAMAAKRAGFDALVVTGSCAQPSVLVVDGCGETPTVHLEAAEDLWGLSAADAEARLKERLHRPDEPGFHTVAIGPAGEHLVRFATLSHDGRHAGRGGSGAVLGAKLLKAIAVRGDRHVPVAHPKKLNALARDLSARSLGPATEKYRELGTVANMLVFNRLAVLPTRNFQESTFEGATALSAEALATTRKKTRKSCAACTIGCEHVYGVRGTTTGVRLEYESLFALGSLCGIGDPDAVLEAVRICDELGLDTISAGGTIAFTLECIQRGLLDPDAPPAPADAAAPAGPAADTQPREGLRTPVRAADLRFGNGHAVHHLLRAMGHRQPGLGHLLAEGSRQMSAVIGGDAPAFAPHVKGLEIPGYEPRALQAMALGFAVGTRGADHNRSSAYEVDFAEGSDRLHGDAATARASIATEDRAALMDSLILCKFLRGVFNDFHGEAAELLEAVTGWEMTADELRRTARRLVTARKWFNQREGWTEAEDTLPERFFRTPLRDGPSAGAILTRTALDEMRAVYYRDRGWNLQGEVPATLRRELEIE
ncbi:MAG: aldehyde ferredoxin oxidoreductase family protein [Acidobacteria bacterium]|nr:aldehyde ferredoxin oxidoreductase family protein [Acidobacteriota bacterium]